MSFVLNGYQQISLFDSLGFLSERKQKILEKSWAKPFSDIINKETILKLLDSYKGTLIIVSHDRYLIDKVCNKVLLIENNKATLYNYGYKEYLEKRNNFNEEMVVNKVRSVKKEKKKDNSLAIKEIESEITRLENKVNELNNELLKEEVYMDNIKSKDILNQIDSLKALLDKKISEWEDLNTL